MLRTLTNRRLFRLRLVVLLAVFSFAASNAVAIPLSEYQELVAHVIGDFQSLLDKDEDETQEEYETGFSETLDAVREEFPKTQQVESGNKTWTTDNTWLHNAIDDLQRANIEKRREKIVSIIESLRAMDQRMNELETAETTEDNKAAGKEKLAGILTRPEYATGAKGENALIKFIRDAIRWFQSLFPKPTMMEPSRANALSRLLQIVVVILGLAAVGYAVFTLLKRFKGPGRKTLFKKKAPRIVLGERLEPEDTSTDLLAEAEALARRGELRAAIRKAYIALLVELGDRKLISLAQYKTNRDYLSSVRSLPQLHPRLKKLTESFERHWYGLAQATPDDWQDFRAGYREALHTGN